MAYLRRCAVDERHAYGGMLSGGGALADREADEIDRRDIGRAIPGVFWPNERTVSGERGVRPWHLLASENTVTIGSAPMEQ